MLAKLHLTKIAMVGILILLIIVSCSSSKGTTIFTTEEAKYRAAINERSYKIVAPLMIRDSSKFYKVRDVIALQYMHLHDIQADKEMQKKSFKERYTDKDILKSQYNIVDNNAVKKVDKLHVSYMKKLMKYLNAAQIDKVKDGMTYGVLPITYKAYMEMIPSLKPQEKAYIFSTLSEARELAMDGNTSDEKHAIFGKYKGRINNYLSKAGYDITKERGEWDKRIKEQRIIDK